MLDPSDELNRLGIGLAQQGKLHEAAVHFQQALTLRPDSAQTHNNLGLVLQHLGRLEDAVRCYRRSLEFKPDNAGSHNNLGTLLLAQGQLKEAITCFQRAVQIKPAFAEAHNNLINTLRSLGNALKDQGRLVEAVAFYQQALQLQPGDVEALNELGNAWMLQAQYSQAEACYRQALQGRLDFAEAHNNLGNALQKQARPTEAIACYQHALRIKPDYANAFNNLANTWKDQGLLPEAIAAYRQALALKPKHPGFHSNMLYILSFCPDYDAQMILAEHRRWNQQHAEPLASFIEPHANDRSPERRLRIGYVSPDFSFHPVGRFLLPLLQAHDHECVEIFCYASVHVPDECTDQCRAHADVWRDVLGLSDEQLAQTIRQDRIDILVDLSMHMAHNRLLAFARKPAPVQVTYLAYCGTTGLDAMDYRLTDPYLDARDVEGEDRRQKTEGERNARDLETRCYAEESIWLPQTYWCYRPPIGTLEVHALPALRAKHVTFGCLNNFCKVTEPTLGTWSRLLQALPESRLLLHAKAGSHRDHVRDFFSQHDVAPERLSFLDEVPIRDYFRIYEHIDVALDPFPHGGGTTTCDALWMGVPVVSLAGSTAVGRAGLSILSNVGLADLVAHNVDQYVHLAQDLARDLPRLSTMRAGLRERMLSSPLMDASRFARAVEAAYRDMWQRWCATPMKP